MLKSCAANQVRTEGFSSTWINSWRIPLGPRPPRPHGTFDALLLVFTCATPMGFNSIHIIHDLIERIMPGCDRWGWSWPISKYVKPPHRYCKNWLPEFIEPHGEAPPCRGFHHQIHPRAQTLAHVFTSQQGKMPRKAWPFGFSGSNLKSPNDHHICMCIYIYMYIYMCVCVCVCTHHIPNRIQGWQSL
jgi:hypothetical protein